MPSPARSPGPTETLRRVRIARNSSTSSTLAASPSLLRTHHLPFFSSRSCCGSPSISRPVRRSLGFGPRYRHPADFSSWTVLDSDFSESISTVRLAPPSKTVALFDRFSGDSDEFAVFSAQKLSGEDQKPPHDSAASEDDGGPAQAVKRRRLTTSTTSVGGDEQKTLREFRLVKVPDCRLVFSL